jgi:hypothetical protein
MSTDQEQPEDHSTIPVLAIPPEGFQSRIPPYLIEGKDESEVFLLNEMSKNGQVNEWVVKALLELNVQVRRTNGNVRVLNDDYADRRRAGKSWRRIVEKVSIYAGIFAALAEIWYYLATSGNGK